SSVSAFSGYCWPADVILTAVRWSLAYPLSSRQALELLAERGIDASHRTVLDWGPSVRAAVRSRGAALSTSGRETLVCGRGVPVPQRTEAVSVSGDRGGWRGHGRVPS